MYKPFWTIILWLGRQGVCGKVKIWPQIAPILHHIAPNFDLPWPPMQTRSNCYGSKVLQTPLLPPAIQIYPQLVEIRPQNPPFSDWKVVVYPFGSEKECFFSLGPRSMIFKTASNCLSYCYKKLFWSNSPVTRNLGSNWVGGDVKQ